MGAPRVPPLCREAQFLGQQMLKEPLGINGLIIGMFRSSGTRSGQSEVSKISIKIELIQIHDI